MWKRKIWQLCFWDLIPSLETACHCVARTRSNKSGTAKKREGFDWRRKPSDKCLYVGDRVEAHFAVGWYYGSVTRVLEDGTYDIDYDDGDKERGVKRNLIHYVGKKKKLSVGDRVSAHFDGKFYPCTITRVRNRREYDILYDDGDVETKKNIDLMRRIPTDDVRKAKHDNVRKSNHDHVRKSNDKSDTFSSYYETMLEPTAVSKSKRGCDCKQVKRYVGSFEGGKDWYEAQNKLWKEDLKALKTVVYRNGMLLMVQKMSCRRKMVTRRRLQMASRRKGRRMMVTRRSCK